MSKILANQIANYTDNAPIEIKEGLNFPAGKPLQVNGTSGTTGQVLTSTGSGIQWTNPNYFSGAYADLTGLPTIPAPQVNSDWNATTGVARILNKPLIPAQPSVVIGPAQGGGDLTYNNVNGQFTFTPPNLSSFSTFSGNYADLSGKPNLSIYLTSYTETDPIFSASPAASITTQNKTNWTSAYNWGNHATVGYLTAEVDTLDSVTGRGNTTTNNVTVNDMTVNGDLTVIGTTTTNNQATLNVAATEIVINDGQSGAPGLDGFVKIDRGTANDVSIKWNEGSDRWQFTNDGTTYYNIAIGTNDLVNNAGFITSFTETDPVFTSSVAFGIGASEVSNWNSAYAWGNHALSGYLTSESDTLDDVVGRGNTTSLAATFGNLTCSNLTVTGTTTTINTTQLVVSDNLVVLNNDVTTTPTENAGIEVERGLSSNVRLLWNETNDRWTFTNNGSTYYNMPIALGDLDNDVGYITGYTETDPVFDAHVASSITTTELANWNAAYNWGDHATAGYLTSISSLNSITDVAISSVQNNQLLRYNSSTSEWVNWTPNYLTSYTETDPVFTASPAGSITTTNKNNWTAAYNWGNHASQGYITSASISSLTDVDLTIAPTNGQILKWDSTTSKWKPANDLSGDGGGISLSSLSVSVAAAGNSTLSYNNTTGVFTYTPPNLSAYLTSFTETDPVFSASVASGIDTTDVSNWDTAYGWGDHSVEGYLTSYTETDTLQTVTNRGTETTTTIQAGGFKLGDNNKFFFGTDSDFELYCNGNNLILQNGSLYPNSDFYLNTDNLIVGNPTGTARAALFDGDGKSELYYAGQAKIETTSTGIGVNGDINFTGSLLQNGSAFSVNGLQSRTTAQVTTASIASGSSVYATIVAAKSYLLQKIETSAAAWVTLYTDTTSRSNDATRNEITDPLPGSGVIAEVITTAAATQKITPGTMGWNDDGTPSENVYLKVVNKSGSTQAITVTLTYVQLEA